MESFVQTNIDIAVSVTITYDEDFKKYLTMIKSFDGEASMRYIRPKEQMNT